MASSCSLHSSACNGEGWESVTFVGLPAPLRLSSSDIVEDRYRLFHHRSLFRISEKAIRKIQVFNEDSPRKPWIFLKTLTKTSCTASAASPESPNMRYATWKRE